MNIRWKEPAVPRHVLQMLVYDKSCQLLVIHRSIKVKSAKNVWSIPTGTHEIGENSHACIVRELNEEFSLTATKSFIVDQYENIAGDTNAEEQYHWILSLYGVVVPCLLDFVNNEPELHDEVKLVDFEDFICPSFMKNHTFHPSLHQVISENSYSYVKYLYEKL